MCYAGLSNSNYNKASLQVHYRAVMLIVNKSKLRQLRVKVCLLFFLNVSSHGEVSAKLGQRMVSKFSI